MQYLHIAENSDNSIIENKILEINARVWFHSWLSAKCGGNIFLSSYLDAIGEKIESKQEYATGVKSIYIDYDIKSARTMFQRGELTAPQQQALQSQAVPTNLPHGQHVGKIFGLQAKTGTDQYVLLLAGAVCLLLALILSIFKRNTGYRHSVV